MKPVRWTAYTGLEVTAKLLLCGVPHALLDDALVQDRG